jgi:uncharacterized protein (TIGR02145 family)
MQQEEDFVKKILCSLLILCSLPIAQEEPEPETLAKETPAIETPAEEAPLQEPIYETVAIGTQTWLRYDLNVVSQNDSWCYNNVPQNCVEYGRLYDWVTAMNLPVACNSSSCASQIKIPHKGICPDGYHIPTKAEWDKLFLYVGGDATEDKKAVRKKLRATSGWKNSFLIFSNNGTDDYGFSALPGGHRDIDGSFGVAGKGVEWWSANEEDAKFVYQQNMECWPSSECAKNALEKSTGLSVRCIKD